MGETLTLPVPDTLHATYAVAFTSPPPDPRGTVRDELARRHPAPLRDLALRMLDSPLLTLDLRPSAEFPPLPADLLAAFGAGRRELLGIAAATHLLAVRASYRPGWPPAHEWAARAIAGAAAGDAPVVDVFTPQVLDQDRLLRSLPGPGGAVRLVDWVLLPHTPGPGGFYFATKGLARFGLPELQTENVPAHLVEPWGRLLNGLASRVLGLWLDRIPAGERPVLVDLPEVVRVGLRDVAAAQGEHEEDDREVPVRLRLDTGEEGEPLLTVLPADPGPARLDRLCAALFGTVRPA